MQQLLQLYIKFWAFGYNLMVLLSSGVLQELINIIRQTFDSLHFAKIEHNIEENWWNLMVVE